MAPQTGFAPLDWFLAALDTWGHLIVIGFTIFENLFLIGSITPGETVVMGAGFVSVQGTLNPWLVGVSSLVGTLIGSNLSYLFGRRGGREALHRWGGRFFDGEDIKAAEEYFEKHGSKTVLVSRFAAGVKNWVPALAGVTKMNLVVFEAWTLAGAIIYTTLMVMIGRIFGENFDKALAIGRNLTWFGLFLFLAMVSVLAYGRHRLVKRRIERLALEADLEDALLDEAEEALEDEIREALGAIGDDEIA